MTVPAKKEKEYTELQTKFLAAIPECDGNLLEAKRLAGYSDTTPVSAIVKSLREEIIEVCELMLARHAPEAVANLVGIMHKPDELGAKTKMEAANKILDRVGVVKKEEPSVTVNNPIFILPAKNPKIQDFIDIDGEVIDTDS